MLAELLFAVPVLEFVDVVTFLELALLETPTVDVAPLLNDADLSTLYPAWNPQPQSPLQEPRVVANFQSLNACPQAQLARSLYADVTAAGATTGLGRSDLSELLITFPQPRPLSFLSVTPTAQTDSANVNEDADVSTTTLEILWSSSQRLNAVIVANSTNTDDGSSAASHSNSTVQASPMFSASGSSATAPAFTIPAAAPVLRSPTLFLACLNAFLLARARCLGTAVFTVTGGALLLRSGQLELLATLCGAAVTDALMPNVCTHVVAVAPGSKKYQFAVNNDGMTVVSHDFLAFALRYGSLAVAAVAMAHGASAGVNSSTKAIVGSSAVVSSSATVSAIYDAYGHDCGLRVPIVRRSLRTSASSDCTTLASVCDSVKVGLFSVYLQGQTVCIAGLAPPPLSNSDINRNTFSEAHERRMRAAVSKRIRELGGTVSEVLTPECKYLIVDSTYHGVPSANFAPTASATNSLGASASASAIAMSDADGDSGNMNDSSSDAAPLMLPGPLYVTAAAAPAVEAAAAFNNNANINSPASPAAVSTADRAPAAAAGANTSSSVYVVRAEWLWALTLTHGRVSWPPYMNAYLVKINNNIDFINKWKKKLTLANKPVSATTDDSGAHADNNNASAGDNTSTAKRSKGESSKQDLNTTNNKSNNNNSENPAVADPLNATATDTALTATASGTGTGRKLSKAARAEAASAASAAAARAAIAALPRFPAPPTSAVGANANASGKTGNTTEFVPFGVFAPEQPESAVEYASANPSLIRRFDAPITGNTTNGNNANINNGTIASAVDAGGASAGVQAQDASSRNGIYNRTEGCDVGYGNESALESELQDEDCEWTNVAGFMFPLSATTNANLNALSEALSIPTTSAESALLSIAATSQREYYRAFTAATTILNSDANANSSNNAPNATVYAPSLGPPVAVPAIPFKAFEMNFFRNHWRVMRSARNGSLRAFARQQQKRRADAVLVAAQKRQRKATVRAAAVTAAANSNSNNADAAAIAGDEMAIESENDEVEEDDEGWKRDNLGRDMHDAGLARAFYGDSDNDGDSELGHTASGDNSSHFTDDDDDGDGDDMAARDGEFIQNNNKSLYFDDDDDNDASDDDDRALSTVAADDDKTNSRLSNTTANDSPANASSFDATGQKSGHAKKRSRPAAFGSRAPLVIDTEHYRPAALARSLLPAPSSAQIGRAHV